jgi:hypothetical protein
VTKPLPFTEHSVRRRIAAAKKEGLRVKGIANDGTVLVDDGDNQDPEVASPARTPSKWEDAGA